MPQKSKPKKSNSAQNSKQPKDDSSGTLVPESAGLFIVGQGLFSGNSPTSKKHVTFLEPSQLFEPPPL